MKRNCEKTYTRLFYVMAILIIAGLSNCKPMKTAADTLTPKQEPKTAEEFRLRGVEYYDQGDYTKALSDFNKAIELDPSLAYAYLYRGFIYHDQGDYTKALADYGKAIELDSSFARAYRNRGNLYRDQEDYTKALADYNKAIELDPSSASGYYNRGLMYYDQKNYPKALTDSSKAIELDPSFTDAYYIRGWIYHGQEDYAKALVDFNKTIELSPSFASAYFMRGRVYHIYAKTEDDYYKAIKEYEAALNIDPNFNRAGYANANIGVCYYNIGDYSNARLYANKALEIDKNDEFFLSVSADIKKQEANIYDASKFAIVPSNFKPADYDSIDLFTAVANVEKMPRGNGTLLDAMVTTRFYVSDVVFVSQNGTDILFKTADNAISQHMKVDSRSGLTAGQKVRLYYRVTKNPLTEWRVIAIERL